MKVTGGCLRNEKLIYFFFFLNKNAYFVKEESSHSPYIWGVLKINISSQKFTTDFRALSEGTEQQVKRTIGV